MGEEDAAVPDNTANGRSEEETCQASFEEALERLEEIVGLLESGELDLDRSLVLFQEGIGLARHCSKKLDEAESRIELLIENSEGELETAPFDEELEEQA